MSYKLFLLSQNFRWIICYKKGVLTETTASLSTFLKDISSDRINNINRRKLLSLLITLILVIFFFFKVGVETEFLSKSKTKFFKLFFFQDWVSSYPVGHHLFGFHSKRRMLRSKKRASSKIPVFHSHFRTHSAKVFTFKIGRNWRRFKSRTSCNLRKGLLRK